ncbi:MAG TPA: amidohydrolase [Candidatus Dormibacteraeota bacterium]|nr:amidohydrolase [Candidatus Dormibacteraeota bacterium]
MISSVLFAGCTPEVACGIDGRILAVGPRARDAAGRKAEVIRLKGTVWPGLIDSHIHLEGLADAKLTLDLSGAASLMEALARVKAWAKELPRGAWIVGSGWYNDVWPDPAFPTRHQLDAATGRRPAYLRRKDGHSAWVNTEALRHAGFDRSTVDPPGGSIDRDELGEPAGILRELAMQVVWEKVPRASDAELDGAMASVLDDLAGLGLTAVHSMDSARGFGSLQRLRAKAELPVRVTYNIPVADLGHAERIGLRSGWGDPTLRVWGVKAFLDGSLGSRTAEMLDGTGTARLGQSDLEEIAKRCAKAELNVCWHAIGDGAVRRALDALTPHRNAWPMWRPRIEHAQCVHPKDMARMARLGVIASMQPIHAATDREIADAHWADVVQYAYAWRALEKAGVRLAFGSDAPVETADPIAGMAAATIWRKQAKWHPELALTQASALRAYTSGAAYAAGMEDDAGALRPGKLCDMTVIEAGYVATTVVGGRVTWRRKLA